MHQQLRFEMFKCKYHTQNRSVLLFLVAKTKFVTTEEVDENIDQTLKVEAHENFGIMQKLRKINS